MADEVLRRTARAIHTLFYATSEAAERRAALEASITTDEELEAFQALNVGLINFAPIPPQDLERAAAHVEELERWEAARPKAPSDRIQIQSHDSEDGRYVRRLLERMYTRWQGTLDYEPGRHRFCFYSPFDEQGRRVTVFASVAVDGRCPDLHARSYVLGPYLRVVDARTKRESDDPWGILAGDLTLILPEEGAAA